MAKLDMSSIIKDIEKGKGVDNGADSIDSKRERWSLNGTTNGGSTIDNKRQNWSLNGGSTTTPIISNTNNYNDVPLSDIINEQNALHIAPTENAIDTQEQEMIDLASQTPGTESNLAAPVLGEVGTGSGLLNAPVTNVNKVFNTPTVQEEGGEQDKTEEEDSGGFMGFIDSAINSLNAAVSSFGVERSRNKLADEYITLATQGGDTLPYENREYATTDERGVSGFKPGVEFQTSLSSGNQAILNNNIYAPAPRNELIETYKIGGVEVDNDDFYGNINNKDFENQKFTIVLDQGGTKKEYELTAKDIQVIGDMNKIVEQQQVDINQKFLDVKELTATDEYINTSKEETLNLAMSNVLNTFKGDANWNSKPPMQQELMLQEIAMNTSSLQSDLFNMYKTSQNLWLRAKNGEYRFSDNDIENEVRVRDYGNYLTQYAEDIKNVTLRYAELSSYEAMCGGDESKVYDILKEKYPDTVTRKYGVNNYFRFLTQDVHGEIEDQTDTNISTYLGGGGDLVDYMKFRGSHLQLDLERDLIGYNGGRYAWHLAEEGLATAVGAATTTIEQIVGQGYNFTPFDGGTFALGNTELNNYNADYNVAGNAEKAFNSFLGISPEVVEVVSEILLTKKASDKAEQKIIGSLAKIFSKTTNPADVYRSMRTLNKIINPIREAAESVIQDAAIFNPLDSDYLSSEEDALTYFGAGFSVVVDVVGVGSSALRQSYNNYKQGRGFSTDGKMIEDIMRNNEEATVRTVSRGLGINLGDGAKYEDLAKSLGDNGGERAIDIIVGFVSDAFNNINQIIANDATGLFKKAQKALAAKIITDKVAYNMDVLRKTYNALVERDSPSMLRNQLAKMVQEGGYNISDMFKYYTGLTGKVGLFGDVSNVITKRDVNAFHSVDYPPELDFAMKEGELFSPTKMWKEDELEEVAQRLDDMGVGYGSVFRDKSNFIDNGDGTFTLNKKGLDNLGYKNDKVLSDIEGAITEETESFVQKLRNANTESGVPLYSEEYINMIEGSDGYSVLSNKLGEIVC